MTISERLRVRADATDSPSISNLYREAAARIEALERDKAELVLALANANHALEYWRRETVYAGKEPSWAEGPMTRGIDEIMRSAPILAKHGSQS